ncbi:hypothetical protein COCNU_contig69604725G000010 [Cocos nucifera]|nr:hypothetical protein [Cocos nucifera]
MDVFKDMLNELAIGRENPDGADQGFLASYFPDLLDRPMFHPPVNGTKLDGTYRLPLGYQMDASYYYLSLRWSIPCGPNSVITFPSAPWLKPWYWWSWPVLPLGLSWHEQRRNTIGYGSEVPVILIQSVMYIGIMALTRLARPSLSKLCYNRRPEKNFAFVHSMLKVAATWSILAAYTVPFFLIPRTVHPLLGWSLYMLGASALASVVINAFLLPPLPVLTPWVGNGLLASLAREGGLLSKVGRIHAAARVQQAILTNVDEVAMENRTSMARIGDCSILQEERREIGMGYSGFWSLDLRFYLTALVPKNLVALRSDCLGIKLMIPFYTFWMDKVNPPLSGKDSPD